MERHHGRAYKHVPEEMYTELYTRVGSVNIPETLMNIFGMDALCYGLLNRLMLDSDPSHFMGVIRVPGNGATGTWISEKCRPLANRFAQTFIVDADEYARLEALKETKKVSRKEGHGLSVVKGTDITPATTNATGLDLMSVFTAIDEL